MLEAMALETPIVATDVGGTGDLISDGREGLLVPRRDARSLAEAIRVCITDRASAADRAAAARARVETELSFAAGRQSWRTCTGSS